MAEHIERDVTNADGCGEPNKIQTPFAKIIVGGSVEKPCYSILWWDTATKECNIGFSSYFLDFVFKWLEEEFEIVAETEDVAPVVHGRWIKKKNYYHGHYIDTSCFCSECQTLGSPQWKGCPVCLARMDGE